MSNAETIAMIVIAARTRLGFWLGIDLWPIYVELCRRQNAEPSITENEFADIYIIHHRSMTDAYAQYIVHGPPEELM